MSYAWNLTHGSSHYIKSSDCAWGSRCSMQLHKTTRKDSGQRRRQVLEPPAHTQCGGQGDTYRLPPACTGASSGQSAPAEESEDTVSPGHQASTQMEDLYYTPHDRSADNKPWLWGHSVLFPTTKPGKARPRESFCESAVFSRALTMDEPLRMLERREPSKIQTLRHRS